MDPDKTLQDILGAARDVLDAEEHDDTSRGLAHLVLTLDDWIRKHGFLPSAWLGHEAAPLVRKIIIDYSDLKYIRWRSEGLKHVTATVIWKKDKNAPSVWLTEDADQSETMTSSEARIAATLLRAAANTAAAWQANPPWDRPL